MPRTPIASRILFVLGLALEALVPAVIAAQSTGSVRCGQVDLNRVNPEAGYAYLAPYFAAGGDSVGNTKGSPVLLFEDTLPLGPGHSVHNDIRKIGRGRFNHWGNALYFSASDNSDPRTNGRVYGWGVPSGVSCPVQICGELEVSQVVPDTGLSFFLKENFGFPGDSPTQPDRSSLSLYEGPHALGAPHTTHSDIRSLGMGRYSHWGNALFFSSSDKTDPRTNGRKYYYGGSCRRLADVRFTKLASNAPFFATFDSHNQRIVDDAFGVFVAHLTRMYPGPSWQLGNGLDTQSDWQLLRSTDAGVSFQTVYTGRAGTHVSPVLDADAAGNLYVVEQHFTALKGTSPTLLRFDPAAGFRSPSQRSISGMASDKFTTVYDPVKDVFYYAATSYEPGHPARIATIPPTGPIQVSPPVVTQGSHGFLMYPLLRMDEQSNLYFAWTTQALPSIRAYLYWDIHFMMSPDQGRTWTNAKGQPLRTPVVVDGDGPTDRVTLPDETGTHPWLSSFLPKDGIVHFAYNTQEKVLRKHAKRFDTSAQRFDVDHYPTFTGNALSVSGQGGFFISRRGDRGGMVYFVGQNLRDQTVVVLASDDAGVTWFDYAVGRQRFASLYSVSGEREIGPSGNIYAVFTDLQTKDEAQSVNDVWFMSVKAE